MRKSLCISKSEEELKALPLRMSWFLLFCEVSLMLLKCCLIVGLLSQGCILQLR